MNVKKISTWLITGFLLVTVLSCKKERYIFESGNLVPKTADQDPSVPSAYLNGATLHTEAFGPADSTMIVCLHGGPGADYRYLLNCRDLANYGYRVVFYDQRGCGLSQRFPRSAYIDPGLKTVDILFDELSSVINHYRVSPDQKVVLLGLSWGAMLGTAYTGKKPSAVQGLIVSEPGGLKWDDVLTYINSSHSFPFFGESLNNLTYLDQFISGTEDEHAVLDYKLAMLALKNDQIGEDYTLPESFWRMGGVALQALFENGQKYQPDFSSGINNYQKEVLFVHSEQNKYYSDAWADKISSVFPKVRHLKIYHTGHTGVFTDRQVWSSQTLPQFLSYLKTI